MWKVKYGDEQVVSYSSTTLLATLIHKAKVSLYKEDQRLIVESLLNMKEIKSYSIEQLIGLAFRLGYLYRLFLEKNNVVYSENTTTSIKPNHEQ